MHKRLLGATVLAAVIAGTAVAQPAAAAGDAQAQLRKISELARKALGYAPTCKDGDTWNPEDWYFNPDPAGTHYPQLFDSSPNKKLMARAWYYGWTLYAPASYLPTGDPGKTQLPTAAQKKEARDLLVQSLTSAKGHYTIAQADEVLTTTHFQLYAAGITSAYVLALGNGGVIQLNQNPYTSGDQNTSPADVTGVPITVRDAARLWWREEKALWDKLRSFPGGVATIDAPGARAAACDPSLGVCAPGTGATQLRDRIDVFVSGQIPSGNTNFFDQCYNSSAWMMLKLRLEKNIFPGTVFAPAGATPKIYDTLCILKRPNGDFVFSFPTLRAASDPIFWAASVGGNRSYGPFQAGKPVNPNPAWPPPTLTGATRDWVQGVVAGAVNGATSCPSQ